MNILIVGAGFSGATIARILAEADHKITIIDQRDHIAGNAYDYEDEYGIRIHKYGMHLFHTSNQRVVDFLSRFTDWVPYTHKVKAQLADGSLVTFPPNAETAEIVGKDNIVDVFYRPYTRKMWNKELEELDPSIANRVPMREDMEDRYFPNDTFQALPKDGYTAMFGNILNHDNITVELSTEFNKSMESDYDFTFNAMPIDVYHDFKYGKLPYRAIDFYTVSLPSVSSYGWQSVNFTHDGPYTRVAEWKHFPNHGSHDHMTTLTFERPCEPEEVNGERYYPVKDIDGKNREAYEKYKAIDTPNMEFIGRCGMYVYIDMHQAVSSAMATARRFLCDHTSSTQKDTRTLSN